MAPTNRQVLFELLLKEGRDNSTVAQSIKDRIAGIQQAAQVPVEVSLTGSVHTPSLPGGLGVSGTGGLSSGGGGGAPTGLEALFSELESAKQDVKALGEASKSSATEITSLNKNASDGAKQLAQLAAGIPELVTVVAAAGFAVIGLASGFEQAGLMAERFIYGGKTIEEFTEASKRATKGIESLAGSAQALANKVSGQNTAENQAQSEFRRESRRLHAEAGAGTNGEASLAGATAVRQSAESDLVAAQNRVAKAYSDYTKEVKQAENNRRSRATGERDLLGTGINTLHGETPEEAEKHQLQLQADLQQAQAKLNAEVEAGQQQQVAAQEQILAATKQEEEARHRIKEEAITASEQQLRAAIELSKHYEEAAKHATELSKQSQNKADVGLSNFANLKAEDRVAVINAANKARAGGQLNATERKLLQQHAGEEFQEIARNQGIKEAGEIGGGFLFDKEKEHAAAHAEEAKKAATAQGKADEAAAKEAGKLKALGVNADVAQLKIDFGTLTQQIKVVVEADAQAVRKVLAEKLEPILQHLEQLKINVVNQNRLGNKADTAKHTQQQNAIVENF